MSLPNPVDCIAAIDADAHALDQASRELAEMTDALVEASIAYQDAEDTALAKVEADYELADKKLPSERQRLAHARPHIDPEVRIRWTRLETRRKLIKEWADIRQSALSARQSELRALRAEADAPQPSWRS